MKINGMPFFLKFKRVKCPKCKFFCAMEFTEASKKGIIQCASTDHISPCNFFKDNKEETNENT